MLYTWVLKKTLAYYQRLICFYEAVLAASPDGHVLLQNNHGYDRFIHIYTKDGKTFRRGINRNEEMKRRLARKAFAEASLIILRENASILSGAISRMIPFDPDAILADMLQAYRKFPEEYFFDRDQINVSMDLEDEARSRIGRHRDFGLQQYEQSDYHQEKRKTRTSRGLLTLSKSEAMILEKLDSYGIAYHYEERRVLGDKWIVPDFTFEGAGGRLIFWEHLGMMSNPGYAEDNIEKLRRYQRAGITLGDDLIITYEMGDSIDMRVIDAAIRTELIPKL